jgi:hypothetical protein
MNPCSSLVAARDLALTGSSPTMLVLIAVGFCTAGFALKTQRKRLALVTMTAVVGVFLSITPVSASQTRTQAAGCGPTAASPVPTTAVAPATPIVEGTELQPETTSLTTPLTTPSITSTSTTSSTTTSFPLPEPNPPVVTVPMTIAATTTSSTSTTSTSTTSTSTTTTVDPSLGSISGTFYRNDLTVVGPDPAGTYPTEPGNGWNLPGYSETSNPLVGGTISLLYAGPDNTFATADDVTTTKITNGTGGYSFTALKPGSYRLKATHTLVAVDTIETWNSPGCSYTYAIGQWYDAVTASDVTLPASTTIDSIDFRIAREATPGSACI